jgi:hypothetical protein
VLKASEPFLFQTSLHSSLFADVADKVSLIDQSVAPAVGVSFNQERFDFPTGAERKEQTSGKAEFLNCGHQPDTAQLGQAIFF